MEEVAQVYARALFQVAKEHGAVDTIRDQLGQFVDVMRSDHQVKVFFTSPYFSTAEKKDALNRMIEGAEYTFMNFLESLVERQRMPEIFGIRTKFEDLWDEEMKFLPVEVTSAIELDEGTLRSIAERIGAGTGNRVQLTTVVDPDVLGGIVVRVRNVILDASIRSRLDQLRTDIVQTGLRSPGKEPSNEDQA